MGNLRSIHPSIHQTLTRICKAPFVDNDTFSTGDQMLLHQPIYGIIVGRLSIDYRLVEQYIRQPPPLGSGV
jgi:hypothetical protein